MKTRSNQTVMSHFNHVEALEKSFQTFMAFLRGPFQAVSCHCLVSVFFPTDIFSFSMSCRQVQTKDLSFFMALARFLMVELSEFSVAVFFQSNITTHPMRKSVFLPIQTLHIFEAFISYLSREKYHSCFQYRPKLFYRLSRSVQHGWKKLEHP